MLPGARSFRVLDLPFFRCCSLIDGQFQQADEIITDREKDEGEVDFSYLETGGGFCSDDIDIIAGEGKVTEDSDSYLETNGGFCNDDDNDIAVEERREIDGSDEASLSRPSLPTSVSSSIESDTKFECPRGRSKRPRCEESGGHKVDSSVKAFSAMPYLRRKKKSGS